MLDVMNYGMYRSNRASRAFRLHRPSHANGGAWFRSHGVNARRRLRYLPTGTYIFNGAGAAQAVYAKLTQREAPLVLTLQSSSATGLADGGEICRRHESRASKVLKDPDDRSQIINERQG
jgi:hypothetical protein